MFEPIRKNTRNFSNQFHGQAQKISTLTFGLQQNIIW